MLYAPDPLPLGETVGITLHNRKERRRYEREAGVKLVPAARAGKPRRRGGILPGPPRHVVARTPQGGSGPSELAFARQQEVRELHAAGLL